MSDTTLLRIEHKLDLIMRSLQVQGLMLPSPMPSLSDTDLDTCPVCEAKYRWAISTQDESVNRQCECNPKIRAVPGISKIMNPPKEESDGSEARQSRASDGGSSGGEEG